MQHIRKKRFLCFSTIKIQGELVWICTASCLPERLCRNTQPCRLHAFCSITCPQRTVMDTLRKPRRHPSGGQFCLQSLRLGSRRGRPSVLHRCETRYILIESFRKRLMNYRFKVPYTAYGFSGFCTLSHRPSHEGASTWLK